ncbi:MAG: cytochrome ubiquinol oxidase subunit I [Actinobacteria bacterium HGW-Actinobacteria-7]|nr:MAG: cytochrome ubiquinol oxidase subunit I [Actinobacteria bacterium HGW-Actinobacteria-7]
MDVVALSKLQFAVTVGYHFLFVPLSIGIGLVLVLAERRYNKSGSVEDKAASDFWIKLFTATFAVGVATGIAMEFAFGTNWATYSRFVGDIFGAPLAAEGLFAFFLESTFLAVLLFGRSRVSRRFFYTSTWLVWGGSLLSALWIIIANSWMQTPAGYKIVGEGAARKAQLTNFFEAGFNPSTLPRYFHTVDAILMAGGFIAVAMAAHYLRRGTHTGFARKTMATGIAIAGITTVLMLPIGHWQAVNVVNNQPSKLAAFEGHWDDGAVPLGIIGYIDETNGKTVGLAIPGGVNLLAGDFSRTKSYPGLNSFTPADRPPLQLSFQTYHFMILLWGVMLVLVASAWLLNRGGKLERNRALLGMLVWSPVLPMLSIQLGWAAAEVGRQPWIVWGELRTVDAISKAVPAGEILTTLILFVLFYTVLYVAWGRVVIGIIKRGPELAEGVE